MAPTTGIWIELDSAVKSFFPGQTISGVVIIDNEKPVETTGVIIKFEGKVKVNWSERVTRRNGRSRKFVTVFYTSEETYFKQEIPLWGPSSSPLKSIIMPHGRSLYEFEYTLPSNIPSSFVSRIGIVNYFMEASLRLPRRPVGFVFRMPRKGFVPGETIEFTAEMNNQSSQRVYGMKVTLMQECKFHANANSKSTIRPIRQVQGPQVGPGESEIWIEKMLRIPPIPPSRLATCHIIDVQYFLKLEMALSNMTLNLKDEVPITIGTIPLRDTFASLSGSLMTLPLSRADGEIIERSASKSSLLSNGISAGVILENFDNSSMGSPSKLHRPPRSRGFSISSEHPPFPEYPDLPPPTYQEAILLEKFTEEENPGFTSDEMQGNHDVIPLNDIAVADSSKFIPHYVTYGVSTPVALD